MSNLNEIFDQTPEWRGHKGSLSREEQELAWRLRKEKFLPFPEISRILGKSRTAVYCSYRRYEQEMRGMIPTYGTHAERVLRENMRAGKSRDQVKKVVNLSGEHTKSVCETVTEEMKTPKGKEMRHKELPTDREKAQQLYNEKCEKIALLEAELKEARQAAHEARKEASQEKKRAHQSEMARDFYDEMINVAEKQFNINIRKKAGARQ